MYVYKRTEDRQVFMSLQQCTVKDVPTSVAYTVAHMACADILFTAHCVGLA